MNAFLVSCSGYIKNLIIHMIVGLLNLPNPMVLKPTILELITDGTGIQLTLYLIFLSHLVNYNNTSCYNNAVAVGRGGGGLGG